MFPYRIIIMSDKFWKNLKACSNSQRFSELILIGIGHSQRFVRDLSKIFSSVQTFAEQIKFFQNNSTFSSEKGSRNLIIQLDRKLQQTAITLFFKAIICRTDQITIRNNVTIIMLLVIKWLIQPQQFNLTNNIPIVLLIFKIQNLFL